MVEAARIELASRESLARNTTSVVYALFSLYLTPIDRIQIS